MNVIHDRPLDDTVRPEAVLQVFAARAAAELDRRRAERELDRQRAFADSLLDMVASLVIVVDPRGRIVRFNRACEQTSGWSEAELRGRQFWEVLRPAESRERIARYYAGGALGGLPLAYDSEWQTRSGERRLISWINRPMLDAAGEPTYVLGTGTDVTERRRLEADLRRAAVEWRETFDGLPIGVLVVDASARVVRANRTAIEQSGCASWADIIDTPLARLGPGEPWAALGELVEETRQGKQPPAREVADALTRRTWVVSARVLAGDAEGPGRVVLNFQDMSETVRLKEQLRQSETMAEIGSIVAGVAHEVRNPLFSISATLDAFESRFRGTGGYDRYLGVLRGEIGRLTTLMKDLLDFGRPSRPDFTECRLEDVVDNAVSACAPLARRKPVEVCWSRGAPLPAVLADPARITQVLQNLIENAVHFSPPGGRVEIRLAAVGVGGRPVHRVQRQGLGAGLRPQRPVAAVRAVLHAPSRRDGPRPVDRQAHRLRPWRRRLRREPSRGRSGGPRDPEGRSAMSPALRLLADVAERVATAVDEPALLAGTTALLREALSPDGCGFLLLDADAGLLRHAASFHTVPGRGRPAPIPLGSGAAGEAAQTGAARRAAGEVCVPLRAGSRVLGVLAAERLGPAPFTEADERLLQIVAVHVAGALDGLRSAAALRESSELYRAYFRGSPVALFVSGSDGRYLEVNGAACALTGFSEAELLRLSIPDLLDGGADDPHAERLLGLLSLGGGQSEIRLRRKDGGAAPLPGARIGARLGPRAGAAARHQRPPRGGGAAPGERGPVPQPLGGLARGAAHPRGRPHRRRQPRAVRARRLLVARARGTRRHSTSSRPSTGSWRTGTCWPSTRRRTRWRSSRGTAAVSRSRCRRVRFPTVRRCCGWSPCATSRLAGRRRRSATRWCASSRRGTSRSSASASPSPTSSRGRS